VSFGFVLVRVRVRNARAFPLLPAALASVPFGFVLVRVRVRFLEVLRNKAVT
jgi:hypothetical protein